MHSKTLCIIGAGASGMAAAIEAARYAIDNKLPLNIILLERLPKIGKKILATGNGRCNILNADPDKSYYYGDTELLDNVFSSFDVKSNTSFFKSIGLYLTQEAMGRLYPMSRQASSVLDALRFEISRLGIEVKTDTKVLEIAKKNGKFIINNEIKADALIVAGGGKSSPSQGSDGSCFDLMKTLGIKVNPQFPALTGICTKKKDKSLKGVRNHSELTVIENDNVIKRSKGELQYTEYGLSGIPSMDISRTISEHFALSKKGKIFVLINSLPEVPYEDFVSFVKNRISQNPALLCEDLLSGLIPKKLAVAIMTEVRISPNATIKTLSNNHIGALAELVYSRLIEVTGVLGYDQSQVTAGGVPLDQIEPNTLEAKHHRGVYICGEIINIDGICGGYNLTWAWSSGRLAGISAAKSLTETK